MGPVISSRHNAIVARSRAVAAGDDRTLLLLDGAHLVSEAIDAGLAFEQVVVSSDERDRADIRPLVERLSRVGAAILTANNRVMSAVSPVRSPSPIVALVARPRESNGRLFQGASTLLIVAAHVQDPGNMGAIVRVAEAAGASGLIAAGRSADPFGWKALRGSMGSALRLPIATRPSPEEAAADARRHGCRVVATLPDGTGATPSLFETDLSGPLAVLVGSEGAGLSAAAIGDADVRVTIPMRPPVESLNTAVTAALVLYEARRQRR